MSRWLTLVVALVALSQLSACGNKGALYLPDAATESSTEQETGGS